MSTKTTIKRISLVAVSALGFGMLSVVTPAANAVAQSLVASVGPNGQTSLTVVGTTTSTSGGALVRLDVVSNDTSSGNVGLGNNESITATVIGVPTGVTAKTVAANGGGMDSATSGSDLVALESTGQATGSVGATAADATSSPTDWTLLAAGKGNTYIDSAAAKGGSLALASDGVIGSKNSGYINMDTNHELTGLNYTKSYYVTIVPRSGATVLDQGAYTVQFQLTDANGIVRGTKTVKIDFVSAASKSDAILAIGTSGTFVAGTTPLPFDTQTGSVAGPTVNLTLTNRDGGLVRNSDGSVPTNGSGSDKVLFTIQSKTTAAPTFVDSGTATIYDNGTNAQDYGSKSTTSPGNGTLRGFDGVYGLTWSNWPIDVTTTGVAYQFWAGYGNATIKTLAFTLNAKAGTGAQGTLPSVGKTDVLVTATGMSVADQAQKSDISTTSTTWTLPTSTTTGGSIKFTIQDSSGAAVSGAAMTVTPTWSGTYGSASVTPASSTTATSYTTDASGNFSVAFTNTAPVAGATLTLAVGNAAGFNSSVNTVVITWAKPVATTLKVTDPVTGTYVKTSSANTATVKVTDQFGNAVSGESVTIANGATTDANYSATTTFTPIVTGAAGTATFTWTGGATAATSDTFVFTSSTTSTATDSVKVTYTATLPAVASLTGYYNTTWTTTAPAVLVPVNGNIYSSGTTKLLLQGARNISLPLSSFSDAATDDMIAVRFGGLTSASAAATGAVVTLTAPDGGWILDASGLPVKSKTLVVASTGYTGAAQILATKTGALTFTATSGTSTATFTLQTTNAVTDARYVTLKKDGNNVIASVTGRYGNGVAGATVQISTSVGTLGNGQATAVYTTDTNGNVTVDPVGQGDAVITAIGTNTADYTSVAGYVGTTIVESTVTAGNSTATLSMTLADVTSQDAIDAANEATDAANAATDAANAAAEAADAATAAAQDAQAAVAALASQVADLIAGIKAQITALTNLVIKIQKKVKA